MYSTLILKNQFGEQSDNVILGGSSRFSANFTVASTDGAGFGVSGLSVAGVANVFMHTTVAPGAGNPNPVSGLILVQFLTPFVSLDMVVAEVIQSPLTGTPVNISAGLTVGQAYVITSVGTSTPANWQALGLPVGVTPAVGVSFICTSAALGVGSGVVQLSKFCGVNHIELVAGPVVAPAVGYPYLILATYLAAVLSAPIDGSIIKLDFSVVPAAAPLI